MTHSYHLPDRATTYVDSVAQRCENLIGSGIWSGLEVQQLRAWLTNFVTPLEHYFAIRILDHLIYRSDSQTVALINQLFQRCLPELLIQTNIQPSATTSVIEALQTKTQSPIRIVPVVDENDPPTKSGPTVSRLIKRALNLQDDWIIFPNQIGSECHREARIIVFVDDFLGTGYQFSKFFRSLKVRQSLSGKTLIYTPLIAHKRGIDQLRRKTPEVKVTFAEQMDDTYNLFGAARSDGVNSSTEMYKFYNEYLRKKNFHLLRKRQLG